jgi:2-keto-3-deoxy-L-rhamnonate aldolase RhmA
MRGHEKLIEMRREGLRPVGGIYLDTNPSNDYWSRHWTEHSMSTAFVDIEPRENIEKLDIRFVTGLDVVVVGENESRVMRIGLKVFDAGAAKVLAIVGNVEVMRWQKP